MNALPQFSSYISYQSIISWQGMRTVRLHRYEGRDMLSRIVKREIPRSKKKREYLLLGCLDSVATSLNFLRLCAAFENPPITCNRRGYSNSIPKILNRPPRKPRCFTSNRPNDFWQKDAKSCGITTRSRDFSVAKEVSIAMKSYSMAIRSCDNNLIDVVSHTRAHQLCTK